MRILILCLSFLWFSPLYAQSTDTSMLIGDAKQGEKLFKERGCYQCHNTQAQGGRAGARLAPNPLPFPVFQVFVRRPVNQMPPYTVKVLPDQELADIHTYLSMVPNPPQIDSIPMLKE